MSFLLGLKPYLWAAKIALVLALLATIGVGRMQVSSLRAELATEKAERAIDARNAAHQALVMAETYRAEEQRLARVVKEKEDAGKTELARSNRIAAGLRADLDGLRGDIATFAAGRRAADNSVAACRRDAGTLGELLADALRREEDATRAAESNATAARTLHGSWPVTARHQ